MIRKLYVHGGIFHADDVFCAAVLKIINNDLEIERVLSTENDLTDIGYGIIMADIGGGTFDHHQKDAPLREDGIKHCAVTLLWKDFGAECISKTADEAADDIVSAISDSLYNGLLKEIAAFDNGTEDVFSNDTTNICDLINSFNPAWDSNDDPDKAFESAVSFSIGILTREIKCAASEVRAESLVIEAVRKMENGIIILSHNLPWEHIVVKEPDAKIVIYPSERGEINLRLVPVEVGSFTTRIDLPEEWKGKRNAESEAYMPGMVFCHATGFLSAFDSMENAKAAARHIIKLSLCESEETSPCPENKFAERVS